jgi:hypothetical protein
MHTAFFFREERVAVGVIFDFNAEAQRRREYDSDWSFVSFAWLSIKSHPKSTPNKDKSAFHPDKIGSKRTFTTRTPP